MSWCYSEPFAFPVSHYQCSFFIGPCPGPPPSYSQSTQHTSNYRCSSSSRPSSCPGRKEAPETSHQWRCRGSSPRKLRHQHQHPLNLLALGFGLYDLGFPSVSLLLVHTQMKNLCTSEFCLAVVDTSGDNNNITVWMCYVGCEMHQDRSSSDHTAGGSFLGSTCIISPI